MAPFHYGSESGGEPRKGEVKLAFKDRHYKEVSKEKAEVVSVEYYDKGTLRWRGHAVVSPKRPDESWRSGSIDCVMV